MQNLRDHVARGPRAVVAEDALVGAQTFYLRAGCGRHVIENLAQAGVARINVEARAIPSNRRRGRWIVQGPLGRLRSRRSRSGIGCWSGHRGMRGSSLMV